MIVLIVVSPARMKSRMNAVPTATSASAMGMAVATKRPEDEQEDDERGEEAEELLRALLDRRELGVAVELDDDTRRFDGFANSVLHRDDPRSISRLDDVRELRFRVGDPTVLGKGPLGERVADAVYADRVLTRRELRRLELRHRVLDRGLALGRVEPFSFGGREDEVEHRALLGCELRLDQIGGALGVRARDLELVLQAPADCRDEQDEEGEDPQPADDHRPRVVGTPAHPARETTGRQSFVCCESLLGHANTPRLVAAVTTRLRVGSHRSNWTAFASTTVLAIRSRSRAPDRSVSGAPPV